MLFAALGIAVAIGLAEHRSHTRFTIAALWLLYEPLLVSFTGGTIGHWRSNLRVVDDVSGGNVSFLKAVARRHHQGRTWWVSFVSMLTTRRSQAIHDLLTHSTVQSAIRQAPAESLYIRERQEFSDPALPSRMRRALVIGVYAIAAAALSCWCSHWSGRPGWSPTDAWKQIAARSVRTFIQYAIFLGWLACALLALGCGWRGPALRRPRALIGGGFSSPQGRRRATSCHSAPCRSGSPPRTPPAYCSRPRGPVW